MSKTTGPLPPKECTCPGKGRIRMSCPVHGISLGIRKSVTFNSVHAVGGMYHVLECSGDCNVAFGCAPQWQPDEVERMRAHGPYKNPINRLPTFVEPLLDDGSNKTSADLRPKTSAERKGEPIHTGVMLYFPDALAAIARLSKAGNDKHNPGEPLHWSRDKSNDHSDCVARHSLTPDAVDDTGETELTAEGWRVLALLQLQQERLLKEKGIMPYSGITP